MASILPSFEYDIFVSYRQKDNRGDQWVTQFVRALETELEATLKESVSIYFDKNPHDGLQETHDVDKSLEGKLKSLILIPIISQTYCDPKSFAWQHEFCAFNKLAREDQFGRDLKLSNGNVASRILPVKINDLDEADQATFENEIGGALRAIDFIYSSPGVNRPLRAIEDHPQDNLHKTYYRDQINKVARAIKERIVALQHFNDLPNALGQKPTVAKPRRATIRWTLAAGVLLGILGFSYYYFGGFTSPRDIDKSVAVLPFINFSNDPDQEYFSDGLTEEVLNVLTKSKDLKVIARTSSFSFKGKNEDVRTIAKKLGVAHILEGSVRKSGDKLRITAQLIKADDGVHIWSETYERSAKDIFHLQDEIAAAILKNLKASLSGDRTDPSNTNAEVDNLLLKGNYFYEKRDKESLLKALAIYRDALTIDSMDARVWAALAKNYIPLSYHEGMMRIEDSKYAVQKALALDNELPEAHRALGYLKTTEKDYEGAVTEYNRVLELQPSNSDVLRNLSALMKILGQYEKAIAYGKRAVELDPVKPINYWSLATVYLWAGQYDQAVNIAKTLEEMQPNYPQIHLILTEIYLVQGKTDLATSEAAKLDGARDFFLAAIFHLQGKKKESAAALEAVIKNRDTWTGLAQLYAFIGMKNDAFNCLEKAYSNNEDRLATMKGDPLLINLRNDPRFNALLTKMKLPVK